MGSSTGDNALIQINGIPVTSGICVDQPSNDGLDGPESALCGADLSEWIHSFFSEVPDSHHGTIKNITDALSVHVDQQPLTDPAFPMNGTNYAQPFQSNVVTEDHAGNYPGSFQISGIVDTSFNWNFNADLTVRPQDILNSRILNLTEEADCHTRVIATNAYDSATAHASVLQDLEIERRRTKFNKQMAATILSDSSGLFLKEFLKKVESSGSIQEAFNCTFECKILFELRKGMYSSQSMIFSLSS